MANNVDLSKAISYMLSDIESEMKYEFDQNFKREAFFTEKWKRRHYDTGPDRGILSKTGALRRSISSEVLNDRVVFTSSLPYSKIHNDGGTITVTMRMKKYFWAKYMEATKKTRSSQPYDRATSILPKSERANIPRRQIKAMRERSLIDASFYRAMAMKRVGSSIVIPKRRYIGSSPEVIKAVREIAEEHLSDFFDKFKIQGV